MLYEVITERLETVDTVVFDKTGTLTEGRFEVEEVVSANGYRGDELLAFAAAASYNFV